MTRLWGASANNISEVNNVGRAVWSSGSWDTSGPLGWCPRLAHNLRNQRLVRLQTWFKGTRNDAAIARASGLVLSSSLVQSLHEVALNLSGHESAVCSGGLRAAAHCKVKPSHCHLCGVEVCPSSDHIYWSCSRFSDLRVLSRPRDELTARLGRGANGVLFPIEEQIAKIRTAHAILSKEHHFPRDGMGWEGGFS